MEGAAAPDHLPHCQPIGWLSYGGREHGIVRKRRRLRIRIMDKYLFSYATATDPPFKRGLIRLVEKATGQPKLKEVYPKPAVSAR